MHEKLQNMLGPLLLFAFIWLVITEFSLSSWIVGLPSIIVATIVFCWLRDTGKVKINFMQLLRFSGWFLQGSIKGGIDVSQRAFGSTIRLKPGFLRYQLQTPPGTARLLVVNCISLLPGTLSTEIINDELVIHTLDTTVDPSSEIQQVEMQVQRLFNTPLQTLS